FEEQTTTEIVPALHGPGTSQRDVPTTFRQDGAGGLREQTAPPQGAGLRSQDGDLNKLTCLVLLATFEFAEGAGPRPFSVGYLLNNTAERQGNPIGRINLQRSVECRLCLRNAAGQRIGKSQVCVKPCVLRR